MQTETTKGLSGHAEQGNQNQHQNCESKIDDSKCCLYLLYVCNFSISNICGKCKILSNFGTESIKYYSNSLFKMKKKKKRLINNHLLGLECYCSLAI